MLNKVNKITSIVSLAIYSLFSVLACYVFLHTALDTCYVIKRADDGGFYKELGSFNTQAIIFIVATVILLSALIFHIISVIKPQKLMYSIQFMKINLHPTSLSIQIQMKIFMNMESMLLMEIQTEFH